ncbi:MAG: DUF1476 domain-containing protein [Pseudomonadota bacterium]
MTTFDNREDAFENKFAHDAELRFKAEARRNKLLGLWAAERMGLEGDAAKEYAATVVKADLEEPGEEDVYRKVKGDLDGKGVSVAEDELRGKMRELLAQAVQQIEDGV